MPTLRKLYNRGTYGEYLEAMQRVALGLRRGRRAEAAQWLAIAERCLRIQSRLDEIRMADDKRESWQKEQPHRLRALQHRANDPR